MQQQPRRSSSARLLRPTVAMKNREKETQMVFKLPCLESEDGKSFASSTRASSSSQLHGTSIASADARNWRKRDVAPLRIRPFQTAGEMPPMQTFRPNSRGRSVSIGRGGRLTLRRVPSTQTAPDLNYDGINRNKQSFDRAKSAPIHRIAASRFGKNRNPVTSQRYYSGNLDHNFPNNMNFIQEHNFVSSQAMSIEAMDKFSNNTNNNLTDSAFGQSVGASHAVTLDSENPSPSRGKGADKLGIMRSFSSLDQIQKKVSALQTETASLKMHNSALNAMLQEFKYIKQGSQSVDLDDVSTNSYDTMGKNILNEQAKCIKVTLERLSTQKEEHYRTKHRLLELNRMYRERTGPGPVVVRSDSNSTGVKELEKSKFPLLNDQWPEQRVMSQQELDMMKENKILKDEISFLQKELNKLLEDKNIETIEKELQKTRKKLIKALDDLKEEKANHNDTKVGAKVVLKDLNKKENDLEKKKKELEEKNQMIVAMALRLKNMKEDMVDVKASIEQEREGLRGEWKLVSGATQKEMDSMRLDLERSRDELRESEAELNTFLNNLQDGNINVSYEAERNRWREEKSKMNAQVFSLKERIQSLEQECRNLQVGNKTNSLSVKSPSYQNDEERDPNSPLAQDYKGTPKVNNSAQKQTNDNASQPDSQDFGTVLIPNIKLKSGIAPLVDSNESLTLSGSEDSAIEILKENDIVKSSIPVYNG